MTSSSVAEFCCYSVHSQPCLVLPRFSPNLITMMLFLSRHSGTAMTSSACLRTGWNTVSSHSRSRRRTSHTSEWSPHLGDANVFFCPNLPNLCAEHSSPAVLIQIVLCTLENLSIYILYLTACCGRWGLTLCPQIVQLFVPFNDAQTHWKWRTSRCPHKLPQRIPWRRRCMQHLHTLSLPCFVTAPNFVSSVCFYRNAPHSYLWHACVYIFLSSHMAMAATRKLLKDLDQSLEEAEDGLA